MCELRIAIVGCGRMGRERSAAALQLGARLVAVCDVDDRRAHELAERCPGCSVVSDVLQLPWDALDAVFVCTPPFARGPAEVAAIQRGIPVFMEKPVGLSAAHVASIQQCLESRPVLTAVGYMNRYRTSVRRARELLAGKNILGVVCYWFGGPYNVPWWFEKTMSGGPVNEQATHLVDLIRYVVGEIVEVGSMTSPENSGDLLQSASLQIRLSQGALCTVLYSCLSRIKMISLQAFTPDEKVQLDGWNFELAGGVTHELTPGPVSPREAIFKQEVAAFFDGVRSRSRSHILCGFEDALQTQKVIDALNRTMLQGSGIVG
jgi:myo-inositol 2-dehydrogenase/D-chiro-inositol 1-dehydrogenase